MNKTISPPRAATTKKPRRTLCDLWADILELAWPMKPDVFEPAPPDLTLLFKAQARLANFSEAVIKGVVGYYREWVPTLTIDQLHALALFFDQQFEDGIAVGEGAKRHEQGE